MKRSLVRASLLALAVALMLGVSVSAGEASGILDSIVKDAETATARWYDDSMALATSLYAGLLALESGILAIGMLLRLLDPGLRLLAHRLILLGCLGVMITAFPLVVPKFIATFVEIGEDFSGMEALQPSRTLDQGVWLGSLLLLGGLRAGFFASAPGVVVGTVSGLVVIFAFTLVAVRQVVSLIKVMVALGTMFFLGFASSRITAALAENWLVLSTRISIEFMMLLLMVALGQGFVLQWIGDLITYDIAEDGFKTAFEVVGGSIAYAWVTMQIPAEFASSLTGPGGLFGLREAMRGGA